ncbi:hypothetical protein [Streptomyces sp. NBC_01207]|uniref:hypothetical protein n=1 Tax=Streptomyces sp. NBC_01207 TaxID=2903772 RepID=UPI002E163938|nr:hypothetical protein OG457_19955 [Streptomyces sp. NBC_01207]
MNPKPYASHGAGDPTAVPAALGLGLLAVGGWLLTTARPWYKPGHPLTLGLGWAASGALLVCGLVLLARCVRTVHGGPEPDADVPAPTEAGTGTGTGTDD